MDDLRAWLSKVAEAGELKQVDGADWDLEIGCLAALNWAKPNPDALLFDNIEGYPKGFRVLTGSTSNARRVALTFNLPETSSAVELIDVFRRRLKEWEADCDKYRPVWVKSGPVMENVMRGDHVDLYKFPVPRWHEGDGGRYIGTGDAVITQDPDTGAPNMGTYRIMVQNGKTTALFIAQGKHGRIHYEKYHAQGKPCPVLVSVGHHPLVFRVASTEIPPAAEFNYAGAVMGEPMKVIREEVTGLPMPADSEIVIAGFCPPGKVMPEGPFGEWTGYYASGETPAPVIEVERVYYRNNPVIMGSPPGKAPSDSSYYRGIVTGALLYNDLEAAGVPDVKGVWMGEAANQMWVVVAIKQRYAGHAKQTAVLASQLARKGFFGRYVVVVDDDIDPTNLQEVLWAVCTRSDPEKDIDIIRRCWSTVMDPIIRKRPGQGHFNSRAIIDACKPFEWINEFPQEIKIDPALAARVKAKWKDVLG
ncbi:MAG: UbiD family decarboxylase [Chloroflexi bacterium]|nr:UbiD family decarboxylase [Chloroflexota bacterium]